MAHLPRPAGMCALTTQVGPFEAAEIGVVITVSGLLFQQLRFRSRRRHGHCQMLRASLAAVLVFTPGLVKQSKKIHEKENENRCDQLNTRKRA